MIRTMAASMATVLSSSTRLELLVSSSEAMAMRTSLVELLKDSLKQKLSLFLMFLSFSPEFSVASDTRFNTYPIHVATHIPSRFKESAAYSP